VCFAAAKINNYFDEKNDYVRRIETKNNCRSIVEKFDDEIPIYTGAGRQSVYINDAAYVITFLWRSIRKYLHFQQ